MQETFGAYVVYVYDLLGNVLYYVEYDKLDDAERFAGKVTEAGEGVPDVTYEQRFQQRTGDQS